MQDFFEIYSGFKSNSSDVFLLYYFRGWSLVTLTLQIEDMAQKEH